MTLCESCIATQASTENRPVGCASLPPRAQSRAAPAVSFELTALRNARTTGFGLSSRSEAGIRVHGRSPFRLRSRLRCSGGRSLHGCARSAADLICLRYTGPGRSMSAAQPVDVGEARASRWPCYQIFAESGRAPLRVCGDLLSAWLGASQRSQRVITSTREYATDKRSRA